MRSPCVLPIALAAAALAAAPAGAAEYVAAPGATRTEKPCTNDLPCQVNFAVNNLAGPFDVATLTAGTYDLGGAPLTIDHGSVVGAPGAAPTLADGSLYVGDGTSASHLSLAGATTDAALVGIAGGKANDIRVEALGDHAIGVRFIAGLGGSLRNAIVHAVGNQAIAVDGQERASNASPQPGHLFKVTAVAEGYASFGVRAQVDTAKPGGGCQVTTSTMGLTDVIARGDGADLRAATYETSACVGHGTANIAVEHSNFPIASASGYGTIGFGSGNQQNPDQTQGVFADAALHQSPTAATVDTGVVDADAAETDPDGDVEPSGARPDMGGDEVPAPASAVTTGTPTAMADGSVRIPVTVSTGVQAARVVVDYGTTTGYGASSAAETVEAGQAGAARAVTLPGTHAGETLHVRARAIVGGDAQHRDITGADQIVAVPAPAGAPAPTATPAPTGTPAPSALEALLSRLQVAHGVTRAKLRRGLKVRATLRGPGTVTLRVTVMIGKHRVTLARAHVTRTTAGVATLRLRASKRRLARLGDRRRVRMRLTVHAVGTGFTASDARRTLVVRRGR